MLEVIIIIIFFVTPYDTLICQLPLYMSNLELHSVLVEKAQSACREWPVTCRWSHLLFAPLYLWTLFGLIKRVWWTFSESPWLCIHAHTYTYSSIYPDSQGMVGGTVSQLSLWSCRSASETKMSLYLYFPSLSTLLFLFLSRNNLMHYMLMKKHSLRGAIPFSEGQLSEVGIASCRPR